MIRDFSKSSRTPNKAKHFNNGCQTGYPFIRIGIASPHHRRFTCCAVSQSFDGAAVLSLRTANGADVATSIANPFNSSNIQSGRFKRQRHPR